MVSKWIKFIKKHYYELMIASAILFFFILIFFYKPISKWLKGKEDFFVSKPRIMAKKYPQILKKNETRCREIFESIFQRPFPSVRPAFLKRQNGYALELDGYNKDLKLAFEYQGIQHYKYWPRFHKSMKDYEDQVKRDVDKRTMCQKNGIRVIEIPYTVKYEKLESYIREQLRNKGLI